MATRYLTRRKRCLRYRRFGFVSWHSYKLDLQKVSIPFESPYEIPSISFSVCSVCCQNHYEVLGVEKNATQTEIKEAYIKQGKELHPDLHRNIEDTKYGSLRDRYKEDLYTTQFKALNEAYTVLSKPDSRRIYDLSQPGEFKGRDGRRHSTPRRAYNTFEERAEAAYGYKIDHDYWNKDNRREGKYKIAFACLIWTIFGTIIQFAAVHWTTRKQIIHMNQQDIALNKQQDEVQINAQKRGNLKNRDNGEYEKLLALYKSDREKLISDKNKKPPKHPDE